MQYYIYKITNTINGKAYISQHIVKKEAPRQYMGQGVAIREAMRQYGRKNFTKEILEYIEDNGNHSIVDEREKYWIQHLNTRHPNGYNLAPGGIGGCTPEAAAKVVATKRARGTDRPSMETKRKMSEAAKGKKFSTEHKQHLSDHHHLKTEHTIIFEDGRTETTTEPFTKIASRFGTSQNTLLRHSARKKFINGIMLADIGPSRYACCNQINQHKILCIDPITHETCSYPKLYARKRKNPNTYANVNMSDCIIKKG